MLDNTTFKAADFLESVTVDKIINDVLRPEGLLSVGSSTTGLDKSKVASDGPTIDQVVEYMGTIDFGPEIHHDDLWDCTERAIWGIVHIRRKFPGCPVGMVEGIASVGNIDKDGHALIIIWDKNFNFLICDPIQLGKEVTFHPNPVRITAFPFDLSGQSDKVEPLKKLNLPLLREGNFVNFDLNYRIFPMIVPVPGRNGVIDYLQNAIYERECVNFDAHPGNISPKIKTADIAFWAYSHVRRVFRGCAIGVAFGTPENEKNSKVVNIIMTKEGGKIKPIYFDPTPHIREQVGFKPNRVLF